MSTWLQIPGVEVLPLPDRANEVKLPDRTHGLPAGHTSSFEVRTWAGQRSRKQTALEQLTERMQVAGKRARYVFVSDVQYREFDVKRRWWLRWLGPIHREQAYCYAAIVPVSMREIDAMIYEGLVKPFKEAMSEPSPLTRVELPKKAIKGWAKVDFNEVQDDGRVCGLEEDASGEIVDGATILLEDGEGNSALGVVVFVANGLVCVTVNWGSWRAA